MFLRSSIIFLLGNQAVAQEPRALLSERLSSEAEVQSESGYSGTIYVVRHADTNGAVKPYGINAKGLRRAEYMKSIFDGSVFEPPASIIAAQVKGKIQRMQDTVAPLAKHLGIQIDTTVGPLVDDPYWTEQPPKDAAKKALAALKDGPVLIAWWSYIKYLCKDLGHTCPGGVTDFKGNDQVLVVTVKNGAVKSMTMENENFKDNGPSPSPSPAPSPRPTPTPSPSPSSGVDTLLAGARLESGAHLVSARGAQLGVQDADGDLVLRDANGKHVWSSGTSGHPGSHLVLQGSDGNLVLRDSSGKATWSSHAHSGAVKAMLHDDCRFEVSNSAGQVLWSLGTSCSSEQMDSAVV